MVTRQGTLKLSIDDSNEVSLSFVYLEKRETWSEKMTELYHIGKKDF